MTSARHTEFAFETVIEHHLLQHGYVGIDRDGYNRERAIFPATVLAFIRETQPKEWTKLEALHGNSTGEQILADLCKWMDANGSLATLRHGFKCYGRTLRVAFFKAAHELNPELEERYAAEPPRRHPAASFLAALREVARRRAEPERHSRRHAELKNPHDGPDGRERHAPVPAGPRPARADLRVQAADAGAFRASIPRSCS